MTDLRSRHSGSIWSMQRNGYDTSASTRPGGLGDFVAFMEEAQRPRPSRRSSAMEWATMPPDRHASWTLRLTDVRGFARHISNLDPRTEVPPVGVLPGWKRAKPYLYSATRRSMPCWWRHWPLPPEGGLRRWTYHTLFGLIVVTGMRLSEAMAIERDDVDLDMGVLTVRLTKFGKSRLVPLHPTTSAALSSCCQPARCASLRRAAVRRSSSPSRVAACCIWYVHRVFWHLSREIGLRQVRRS